MKSTSFLEQTAFSKALSILLIIVIVITIGAIIYLATSGKSGEPFTEFYILGIDGKADNYPSEIAVNESTFVILGIVNRENVKTDYRIEISINGLINNETIPVTLEDQDKWEKEVNFIPHQSGENQKVEFCLYKDQQNDPYLTLYLFVNVADN